MSEIQVHLHVDRPVGQVDVDHRQEGHLHVDHHEAVGHRVEGLRHEDHHLEGGVHLDEDHRRGDLHLGLQRVGGLHVACPPVDHHRALRAAVDHPAVLAGRHRVDHHHAVLAECHRAALLLADFPRAGLLSQRVPVDLLVDRQVLVVLPSRPTLQFLDSLL